ncbi:hypothetical protein THAR02_00050 [Trichoderma harzianum]|uniref:Xylanolytic transcriptional activator regulatory domain-containing protein n=1 Tax=Trichoderma harzianum TaxID=5544 RepID=A0A0G0A6N0_TRIHA|nr:hypothetical protein THAR02_00050 [Trichoderma harzianum]
MSPPSAPEKPTKACMPTTIAKDKHQASYQSGARAQLARPAEAKSNDQEPHICQDGRIQMPGWDLIDGRKGVHYMSALNRLARNEQARTARVSTTRAGTNRPEKEHGCQRTTLVSHNMRLDDADKEYLRQKGTFTLPSQAFCETMLRQHFVSVYPQIPVFDYVDFVESYLSGSFSWFMMQAVLASAVPYTAMEVLIECGFTDRLTALQFFFSNAVRLYDFEYEESQLAKLQGSLILSTVLVSYTMDKDFRFWHHNAVRLAVRLGLHKELIQYNVRQAHEVEWWNTPIPTSYASIIPSWTEGQKFYSSEHMKLAIIAIRWQDVLRALDGEQPPTRENIDKEMSCSFAEWRKSLPKDVSFSRSSLQGRVDEIWIAALEASCFRFECIFYRSLLRRTLVRGVTGGQVDALKQRLRMAIFELDTIVSRLMMANLLRFANLNLLGCVTCLLALHIETILEPTESPITRSLAVTYIRRTELALQQICEVVPAMECNLRLLHRFLDQKRLDAASTTDLTVADNPLSGETEEREPETPSQNLQDQSSINELEPRADITNSNLRLQDEDTADDIGDVNDWLDGLVWLDYLKDSNILPS